MPALQIVGLDDLRTKLSEYGVPVEQYGMGDTKTVDDLFNEIVEGECTLSLSEGRVCRELHVACLFVHCGAYTLREISQTFYDGRKPRQRILDASAGEKLKAGEGAPGAVERLIAEELPFFAHVSISPGEVRQESEPSQSYPGILTNYHKHFFSIWAPERVSGVAVIKGDAKTLLITSCPGIVVFEEDKAVMYLWRKER